MRNLTMEGSSNGTAMNGHAHLESDHHIVDEPIAILGMGLRLPGRIHSPESLWELLVNKKETGGPIPASRYNAAGFYSASKRPGTILVQRGHFLDESDALDRLDTSFFSMSKAEVEKMDPQQRMLLEVVWECMENSGQRDWRDSNTGVFVGTWGDDWLDLLAKDPLQTGGMLNVSGAGDFAISNRVSYEYNLQGPSMTIKAACASAMICLHEACQSLRQGDCDAAIVAGTNLIITPTTTIAQTEAGVISPTGECRTFDASANGYARGEAINAILIKRLSDAVRDQDPIRAVIRGTAVNSDGRSAGISAPNPLAHEKMIRRAYKVAGLAENVADTPFVEVHGTGTPSGDPLELQAIASVFGGDQETYIGSVKANVGHGEGASGLTSVIKAVMMLEYRIIPPQVNFVTPNPRIPFDEAHLVVPLEPTQWPTGRPERISVNSFGITGANAHIVVESAASHGIQPRVVEQIANGTPSSLPRLLMFSANTPESLQRRASEVQNYAAAHPNLAKDLSYTLGCRREHLVSRAFCITGGKEVSSLSEKIKQTPTLSFVFTGQGAQWPTMAKELVEYYPEFKDDLAHLGDVLARLPHPPSWNLIDELLNPETKSRLNEAEFAQPLCTAIQVALVNFLARMGIVPSAVVGHSSGEIAAAYASGAITADEAIIIAYYRGRCALRSSRTGAMAAVGMGRAEAALYLEDGVVIACDNSPNSTTLSGDKEAINTVIEQMKLDDPDVFVRLLKTDGMAYHSHHMLELGSEYEQHLQPLLNAQAPETPFFSSVTGTSASTVLGADYWRQNLESPVKFFPAVQALVKSQQATDHLCLEIGPHSALAGPLRQIFKMTASKGRLKYLPSLIRGKNSVASILEACGQLYLHTVDINIKPLNPGANLLTDLPVYPWQHDVSHWFENRALKEWRARKFAPHELLGSRILEGNDFEPTWRNMLSLKNALWLHDHKVFGDVVFPCAGYIAMVGEAVRQLANADDFSIRYLNISTAMILNDDKTVEVVTTFKQSRSSSEWHEFSIYSHNGNTWIKHCDGQAKGGKDKEMAEPQISGGLAKLPREINSPYPIFARIGLHYGSNFQALRSVSAMPGQKKSVASLDPPPTTASAYSLHPTTIDQCLQLLGLAFADGLGYSFQNALLPTAVKQLYIQPSSGKNGTMQALAKAISVPTNPGDVQGEVTIVEDGRVLLSIQGCKLSAFEQQQRDQDSDARIAAARLSWRPDLDFIPLDRLMIARVKDTEELRRLEIYSFLCMLEMQERIRSCPDSTGHFEKFRCWIDQIVEEGRLGNNRIIPNSNELVKLPASDRLTMIPLLREQVMETEFAPAAELVARLLDNCVGVFNGQTQILDVYLRDNGLINLYGMNADRIDSTEFFVTAGHTNPCMRILEIGAGTGGTTLIALQALTSINGEPMYAKYTFTDISSGFFSVARERFADYSGIEFKTLDIGKDPLEQGFELETYDLIIASNVIHATETLSITLKNVRKLLNSRGRFFLQEHTPSIAKMTNFIMGPMPGWWLGEADGRPTEPIVSPERWDLELRGAGFSGIECLVYDDPNCMDHIGVNMIATPIRTTADFKSVTILLHERQLDSDSLKLVNESLSNKGYHIDMCLLGTQQPIVSQDIISLLEVDSPFISQISAEDFQSLQKLIGNLGSSRMLWVMGSAQLAVHNPDYGFTLGFIRSIRAELAPVIATLEVDHVEQGDAELIVNVFEKFQDTASSVNPEQEYALKDGIVYVGRYHWAHVSKELAVSNASSQQRPPVRLDVRRLGGSKVIEWAPYSPRSLGENDVVIVPACAGVSLEPHSGDSISLVALEGSGTVAALGSKVQTLQIGDRVMGLGQSFLASSITTSADQAAKIPDSLTFEDAATMPLAFCTAIYSLVKVANVQRGQTVLIHSACSSVGLAAVQLSQMTGAEIFCTVENDHSVEYLTESFNIPRSHIFYSVDASFLPGLMNVTKNRGVDVVLNSLSGDLLHTSWKCVAPRGKMIQLEPQNLVSHAQLDIDLFVANRSFIGVDATALQDLHQELLNETIRLHIGGHIKAIKPTSAFDSDQIENISTLVRHGVAVEKFVVRILPTVGDLPVSPMQPTLELRGDATYILVGGLGGLGQSISTYLVQHGARHLIYLSRRAGESEEHQRFFRELESQGCSVQVVKADVTNLEDVKAAIQRAKQPIAGIFQMAMVLNDSPFRSMTHDEWSTAIRPRVNGTWNLHEALRSHSQLDFFVILGSVSGTFGIAHQANYSAGNTFQDSFVQYRHAQGLPASVLNIGAMADVGYVSQNRGVEDYFRGAGMPFMSEADFFECLHLSIRQQYPDLNSTTLSKGGPGITNRSQLTLGIRSTKPMDDPSNRVLWKHDRRADIYRNIEAARLQDGKGTEMGGDEDKIAALITQIQSNTSVLDKAETLALVTYEIGVTICNLMLRPVEELDVSKALVTLGVDSLVIVEIRNWLRQRLQVEASTLEILNGGTIETLGLLAVERLKEKYRGNPKTE